MYIATRVLSTGFQLYRCLRSSSALEGYQKWLRMLVEASNHAGPEWLDAVMNMFDFRWNVRAARAVGLLDNEIHHCDMQVRDAMANALTRLPFKEPRRLPNHQPVVDRVAKVALDGLSGATGHDSLVGAAGAPRLTLC